MEVQVVDCQEMARFSQELVHHTRVAPDAQQARAELQLEGDRSAMIYPEQESRGRGQRKAPHERDIATHDQGTPSHEQGKVPHEGGRAGARSGGRMEGLTGVCARLLGGRVTLLRVPGLGLGFRAWGSWPGGSE